MKRLIFILLFSISSLYTYATVCADYFFIEKHVALYLCQNHGRGGKEPLYKGVTKALNDYIALRVARGELEDKQFHIALYDPIASNPQFSLVQGKNAYYIMAQHLSLNTLILLIDEFSKPNFTPIELLLSGYGEEREREEKIMDSWVDKLEAKQLSQSDLDQIRNTEYVLWQEKDLKLIYKNDILKYELLGKDINLSPTGVMPCMIQDRYIIQTGNRFVVYEGERLIKSFNDIRTDIWEHLEMRAEVHPKWVNFGYSTHTEYSYSYDKNGFYLIEGKK